MFTAQNGDRPAKKKKVNKQGPVNSVGYQIGRPQDACGVPGKASRRRRCSRRFLKDEQESISCPTPTPTSLQDTQSGGLRLFQL